MRASAGIAVAVLVLAGAWTLLQARSDAPDAIRARDRLMRGDVVVEFTAPGFLEGYRVTWLADGRWAWERTVSGDPVDLLLFNGERYLISAGEGCFVEVREVAPPLLPGLTVSRELNRMDGVESLEGSRYSYTLGDGLVVIESLSGVSAGRVEALTEGGGSRAWPGRYLIRRADADETGVARAILEAATASPYTAVVVREREIGNVVGSAVHGPYTVAVPDECPATPVQLWPATAGGQQPGPRGTAPHFPLRGDDGVVVEGAVVIGGPITAGFGVLQAQFEQGTPADGRLRTGMTLAVSTGERAILALEVVSCLTSNREPCR